MKTLAIAAAIVLGVGSVAILIVLAFGAYVALAAFGLAGIIMAIVLVNFASVALRELVGGVIEQRRYWRRA